MGEVYIIVIGYDHLLVLIGRCKRCFIAKRDIDEIVFHATGNGSLTSMKSRRL